MFQIKLSCLFKREDNRNFDSNKYRANVERKGILFYFDVDSFDSDSLCHLHQWIKAFWCSIFDVCFGGLVERILIRMGSLIGRCFFCTVP